jgi:hypothetical protein
MHEIQVIHIGLQIIMLDEITLALVCLCSVYSIECS